MATITSSYPNGQSLTSGRNFGPDMAAAIAALMQEERRPRVAAAPAPPMVRRAAPAPPRQPPPAREGDEPLSAALRNAEIEEARARIAAARAISEPAPMRSIRGGPGIVGGVGRSGLQLDTSGMTGAQRRALLPQNSGMAAIPQSGASLAASDLDTGVQGRLGQGNVNEFGSAIGDRPGANSGYAHLNTIDQAAAFQALLRSNAGTARPADLYRRR